MAHHPDDPRTKTREAIESGDLLAARAWAELATAEAIHRLSKVVSGDIPARPIPIERGKTRRTDERPDSTEQAA